MAVPRAMHAEVIRRIAEGKPLAIGVDIVFDKPSSRGPADDGALGAAVAAAGNVILAAAVTDDRTPFYTRTALNPPVPVVRRGAAGLAPINVSLDPDGAIRWMPLWTSLDGERLPGFDARLHEMPAKAGMRVAPLPNRRSVLINFRGGRQTYPWVSYYRVARGETTIPREYWTPRAGTSPCCSPTSAGSRRSPSSCSRSRSRRCCAST